MAQKMRFRTCGGVRVVLGVPALILSRSILAGKLPLHHLAAAPALRRRACRRDESEPHVARLLRLQTDTADRGEAGCRVHSDRCVRVGVPGRLDCARAAVARDDVHD